MAEQAQGQPKTPGELAFERYAAAVGNVNYAGEPLKLFHELSSTIKAGWEAAAPLPISLPDYAMKVVARAYTDHVNYPGDRADIRLYLIGQLARALRIEVN